MTPREITEVGKRCADSVKHNPSYIPVTLLLGLSDDDGAAIYDCVTSSQLVSSKLSEGAVGSLKET